VSAQRYLLLSALGAASLLLATAATFTWPSWSAFAWTYVLGLTFATGVGLWLLIEDVGIEGFVPNASGVVRALKLTLPIAVGLAGQILLWRGDTVALGLTTTDSSEVAVYAIAVAGTGIVWLPVEAVSLMLYRQFALGGPNDQLQRSVIRLSLQAMAIACVVGVVVGAALLAVTSTALPSYRNAVALYMLLLLGVIPASAGRVLFSAATAVRNTRLLWQFSAVALASFALYIPATLIAHGWGAAAASVVMYLITTAILVRVLPLSAPKRMPETTL
jgi:O-antigen/teichoic acid export membrane protein